MSMPSVRPPTSNPQDVSPRTVPADSAVVASGLSSSQAPLQQQSSSSKKKKHRAGRKHKSTRRKSIVSRPDGLNSQHGLAEDQAPSDSFYLQANNSNTSLDSEALLDHREQSYRRPRRASTMVASPYQTPGRTRPTTSNYFEDDTKTNERAPLLGSSIKVDNEFAGYGGATSSRPGTSKNRGRRGSSRSSGLQGIGPKTPSEPWNVNYPPSVPGSPTLDATDPMGGFRDVMMHDESDSRHSRHSSMPETDTEDPFKGSMERRHTISMGQQDDVCMPQEAMSELGDFDMRADRDVSSARTRRRRRQKWPDLELLEDFSRTEKESRSESARRVKKIAEPKLIEGRLRPANGKHLFTAEEEAPYRFTYFNIDFEDTIHSQTISELPQADDLGFKELFLPDPPVLSDSSEDEDDNDEWPTQASTLGGRNGDTLSRVNTRTSSIAQQLAGKRGEPPASSQPPRPGASAGNSSNGQASGVATPSRSKSPIVEANESEPRLPLAKLEKPLRYGDRPVWWLDVFAPTQRELELLSKAFGIHPLTTEDIWLQEEREKVELFRNYYFITYQSFDQDSKSDNFMEPLMMYIVVFREGVISFHWNPTPHPANVRRRIRFLKDYVRIDADWIGYGIIDDVTDVYIPLIQNIEDEVDDIDDGILKLHSTPEAMEKDRAAREDDEKASPEVAPEGHLLHRVGACRKKVMRLYRLLGTKADVIKGFAKRCNEKWQVAPRSDIGMYLGDIQDHIVTMTGNLSHYDVILARCHANYIAQINIRMGERQEATADGLNKLTVMGTIVLPMNIITGLWGMNVWVPGQDDEGYLGWFFLITAGLMVFGVMCYFAAKRLKLV
ncbi:magnesium transporter [Microdochium nivale]|nr:magnesium transporter [Microdochium nivale]